MQVCGFANAQGGVLCIGKDDSGNAIGISDTRRLLEDLPNKIKNAPGITAEVNLCRVGGRDVVEIVVPPYEVPISLRGVIISGAGAPTRSSRAAR
jgi:ATP-dependent DNA helicase RecG